MNLILLLRMISNYMMISRNNKGNVSNSSINQASSLYFMIFFVDASTSFSNGNLRTITQRSNFEVLI